VELTRALACRPEIDRLVILAQRSRLPLLGIVEDAHLQVKIIPDLPVPARLLWEQMALPSLAKRLGIDLLHSLHYTMPLLYRGPSVVTLHDLTFFLFPQLHILPKRFFFRLFTRLSARRAAALAAVSEGTRQDAIRLLGVPPEKIFTTRLGVPPEFHPVSDPVSLEAARRRYGLPARFILFVGLLEPRKNLPMLLRAFAGIAGRLPDTRLVVVGRKGWMVDQALRLVNGLGLDGRVHFTGYVPREDLPLIFNLAEVFVYPSLYEGFGLPVLEALACGTPAITTDVSSMPEIVGEAGVLVPPGDEPRLAQALLDLLDDPGRRRTLSEAGPLRAAAFTWERTAAETVAIYQHVLENSGY
jgi:glycosyltransferase involved in cell wall biosynthesis